MVRGRYSKIQITHLCLQVACAADVHRLPHDEEVAVNGDAVQKRVKAKVTNRTIQFLAGMEERAGSCLSAA